MPHNLAGAGAGDFGDMLISARSLDEYRAMFALTDAELRTGRILDCPSGAASFVAEARRLGLAGRIVGVDLAYARERGALALATRESVERASRYSIDHPDLFVWGWFRSSEHHRRTRDEACARWEADYPQGGAYLAAAVPQLPFPDACFALTLSSHLLFVWADRFDYSFHLAVIRELTRVTQGEVRIFPVIDPSAVRYRQLDGLRRDLARVGVSTQIRRVDYVVQPGGGELLVCGRER
jgi:hypothetical protein